MSDWLSWRLPRFELSSARFDACISRSKKAERCFMDDISLPWGQQLGGGDVPNHLYPYPECRGRGRYRSTRRFLRWFIGDFTPQYFASRLSINCHDSQFHRLPTMKFASSLSVNCHDSPDSTLPVAHRRPIVGSVSGPPSAVPVA